MNTILALVDFSDVTPKVMDQTYVLARAFGSEVFLLHVVPPDPLVVDFAPVPVYSSEFDRGQRQLDSLRDSLAARGVVVSADQFSGPVLETILGYVKPIDPDVIIMGSHGHGAFYNLLIGSVTEGVIKHSTVPVMVVPSAPVAKTQSVNPVAQGTEKPERTNELIGALGGSMLPP